MKNHELQRGLPEENTQANDSVQAGESATVVARKEVPPVGRRLALRDVRRQLTDEELLSPGVQKLLLDMLEDAETERDEMKNYVKLFHDADKKSCILSERLNVDRSIEVFFGVGVGLGGAIIGLAPFFWGSSVTHGIIALVIGVILILGSSVGRIIKR